jgi:hypothetical protein
MGESVFWPSETRVHSTMVVGRADMAAGAGTELQLASLAGPCLRPGPRSTPQRDIRFLELAGDWRVVAICRLFCDIWSLRGATGCPVVARERWST